MNTVKVKRTVLLAAVKNNRTAHRDLFLEAQVGYRKDVIAELDRLLADARASKKIDLVIDLPAPEDHTEDYDRIIAMLEMSVEKYLLVSQAEFNMYVMDNWGWSQHAITTNNFYASKAKLI